MNINFLQIKLSAEENEFTNSSLTAEKAVHFCFQQCEASLQFLHSLCQNKSFRERLLKNKVSTISFKKITFSSSFIIFCFLLNMICGWLLR